MNKPRPLRKDSLMLVRKLSNQGVRQVLGKLNKETVRTCLESLTTLKLSGASRARTYDDRIMRLNKRDSIRVLLFLELGNYV